MVLAKHPFLRLKPDLQARGAYPLEFPEHRFPSELSAMILVRTEGSPLFMSDLVRYLRDLEVLGDEGGSWAVAGSLPAIENELPESVRSSRPCAMACRKGQRMVSDGLQIGSPRFPQEAP